MFGPVLPVELVTSSRRVRYFLVRVLYAAALLLTLWIQYESSMSWQVSQGPVPASRLAEFGREFFESFSMVQLVAVLFLTPALVAGTIAEEKDRRTMEYLLVSDLRNTEIVLGKLAARLLQLLALLAAGWPMVALLMLLGGLGWERMLSVAVVTASTALAVAGLSIWCSVQARRARDAVVRVFLIGFALLVVPSILVTMSRAGLVQLGVGQAAVEQLMLANPVAFLIGGWMRVGTDWGSVGVLVRNQAIFAVPCVVWSVWSVRRVYVRQAFGVSRASNRRRWRLWRPALGDSPLLWKELYSERSGKTLGVAGFIAQSVLVATVMGPAILLYVQQLGRPDPTSIDELGIYVVIVGTLMSVAGLLAVAARAATCVTSERERQTWDLLLSTPIEPLELVRAKVLGSMFVMRGMLVVVGLLMLIGVMGDSTWIPMVLVAFFEVLIFAMFAAALGLFYSVMSKTSLRAMAATMATGLFLGGGYLFCCLPVAWSGADGEAILAGCVPFLLGAPLSFHPEHSAEFGNEGDLVVACIFGVCMYLLAAVALLIYVTGSFGALAGRTDRGVVMGGRESGEGHRLTNGGERPYVG